jgi:outer membrane protein assembly factor BamA
MLGALGLAASLLSPMPAVQTAPPAEPTTTGVEVLVEVRVHGNHTTPDAEVLQIAGVEVGKPLDRGAVERIASRLRASDRFTAVDVRKRYRSLADTSAVVLVLLVQEKPLPVGPPMLRPVQTLRDRFMFLPILSYTDGYGFTYGARGSFANLLGPYSRVSVPLTWGGVKRAAFEGERTFRRGPISRVEGVLSVSSRENPHYRLDDRRVEVTGRVERQIAPALRVGARAGWTDVAFGDVDETFASYGADVTFDTRSDPTFPRNAVLATAGWDVMDRSAGPAMNRYRLDARGFVGVIGQSVLSVRALYAHADNPLPAYQQWLLGGASTLRGYRAGFAAGDNLAASSIELRVPITSPMNAGKLGVTIFADTGTTYLHGQHLRTAQFRTGAGAGFFFIATIFQLNVDVASNLSGGTRVHVSSGFQF